MSDWKTVEPNTWKYENEGDSIEGVLIRVVPRDEKTSTRYYIENPNGNFLVWGSAVLDDRMALVKIGSICRITFKGKVKNSKKQDTKIFKVETRE